MSIKPAAAKLPLAVKKNVRDEWEAQKPGFEQDISKLLGQTWTILADTNLIYANVADADYANPLGKCITWYIGPLVSNLEKFVNKYRILFGPQDTAVTTFGYGGLYIKDGVLNHVYNTEKFASNVDDTSTGTIEAFAYHIVAGDGVKKRYDPEIGNVQKEIASLVGVPDIKLTPNFESNAAKLAEAGSKVRDDWEKILGAATLDYFDAVRSQLNSKGFAKDEMLQEGFQETVPENEIVVRVVDKINKGYNEIVVEDGILYVQTTPDKWWSNVGEVAQNIIDIL